MRKSLPIFLALVVLVLSVSLNAQSMPDMPGMDHDAHGAHHHNDGPEQLGHVSFPTTCTAQTQPRIQRGIALLHSFGYVEAQMQFEAIAKSDPSCAMAHWGIAMTQFQELWSHPDDPSLKRGAEEMATARNLAAKSKTITPREKVYIDALSTFYDPAQTDYQHRADAYTAKMNALHAIFPGDVEGAAFDALAILSSQHADDTTLDHPHQALAILVPLFAVHPEHPGLAHYIIHTCDTPALAQDGLSAAREYAAIAPSSAHALHMPGHIFARLGMWQEDIASNLASVKASEASEARREPGAAHQMHADEFLIYAWLQTGEDQKAQALTGKIRSVSEHMAAMPGMDDMKDAGHFFDNELTVITPLELHDWKALTTVTPAPGSKDYETYETYWGQGVAAGHLHDAALAAAALADLDKSIAAVMATPYAMYATDAEVEHDELTGWLAYAQDKPEAAVTAMRSAADQQDKLGQQEVDIPAREMLGDLLLLEHKPAEALTEYRVALKLSPNRLNGLLSAGTAAEQSGHPDEARTFYTTAAKQTSNSTHSRRPELIHALKVAGITTTASN